MKGFGIAPDKFKTAIKRYGIWPMTVWKCDFSDPMLKELKTEIGDGVLDSSRRKSGSLGYQTKKIDCKQITESIFNPILAVWILNLYGPKTGTVVYDPFAGGGTRAIVCAKAGYEYVGYEIREEEVELVKQRLLLNNAKAEIRLGDSRFPDCDIEDKADFLITCPPYYNMEKYEGGESDLSMAKSYLDFLNGVRDVVKSSCKILKKGAKAAWVVGIHRDKVTNELLSIPSDIARIHKEEGFYHKEEIIIYLNPESTGALRRSGTFEKGNRFLIRCHEYLEVFEKK